MSVNDSDGPVRSNSLIGANRPTPYQRRGKWGRTVDHLREIDGRHQRAEDRTTTPASVAVA